MPSVKSRLILLLSLVLPLLAFPLLLWQFPEANSTLALLQVQDRQTATVFLYPEQKQTSEERKIFQKRQQSLLRSKFVLRSALNRRDISQPGCVVENEPDALEWLQDALQVSFPDEGDILEVRIDGREDPEEIKKLIGAIVESYRGEIFTHERMRAEQHRDVVRKLHSELRAELIKKLDRYYLLKDELAARDSEASKQIHMATTEDMDTINDLWRKFTLSTEDPEGPATAEFMTSLVKVLESQRVPSKELVVQDGELAMLYEETEELKELNRELSLRLRKMRLEDQLSDGLLRVLQPATTTVKRTATQSYGIAGLGSIGAFLLSTVGLSLIDVIVRR